MSKEKVKELDASNPEETTKTVDILEEIEIEDLTIDGICGVY